MLWPAKSDTKSARTVIRRGNPEREDGVQVTMDTIALLAHRRDKDQIFRSPNSPLAAASRSSFEGLNYYQPSAELAFLLEVEPIGRETVTVQTSDGQQRIHERVGVVRFEVNGALACLTLYDTGHPGYFLPFRDATSGNDTYSGGRYLDLKPMHGGVVTVDFNIAYNPLCAYSDGYSCPLPPAENWLDVPIRAGERHFPN
jgi:uncharacterized protein (DUF1684 family)